jgi:hypothetical protein
MFYLFFIVKLCTACYVQNLSNRGTAMKKKVGKGGRPPKRKGERLSKNRTFRVRGLLDEQLIAAAAESGRSVSEEIEYRLERSFLAGRQAVELESLKVRLTRVETQLARVNTVERERENIDPEYLADLLRDLERRREEIKSMMAGEKIEPRREEEVERKIAEAKERQQRLKQP